VRSDATETLALDDERRARLDAVLSELLALKSRLASLRTSAR